MSGQTNENGRNHEPDLREVTADLDGLRDLFKSEIERLEQVATERDKRYTALRADDKDAVKAALAVAAAATQRTQWSTGVTVTVILGSLATVLSFAAIVFAVLHK